MTCTPFFRQKSKNGGAIFMEFKYSYEEKIEAVLRIINDGMSVRESARILGASPANVRMWKELYLKNGPDSLKYKRMTYDGAFKTAVVEYMYQHKLTLLETAIHFGITQSSLVGKWAKQYTENGGSAAFSAGKLVIKKESEKLKETISKETLEEEVIRLRMENEYLKKLQALVQKRIDQENGNEQS